MFSLNLVALAALSAPVFADLMWFTDNSCGEYSNGISFNCGYQCQIFYDDMGMATTNIHSVEALGLEPNTQVVLYKSTDCSGDAYAAIGDSYASSAGQTQCVPSSNDGLGSFQVLVYNSTGGGSACPPGTLTAASTAYPAPTG